MQQLRLFKKLELGDHEEEFHRVIGKNLDPDKINFIYTLIDSISDT